MLPLEVGEVLKETVNRENHIRLLAQYPSHLGEREIVPVGIEAEILRVSRLMKLADLDQVMAGIFDLRYNLLPVRKTLRAYFVEPLPFAGRDHDSHVISFPQKEGLLVIPIPIWDVKFIGV